MHTMDALGADDFAFRANGASVHRAAVMPDLAPVDRVGVAMRTGAAGLGAGTFILASVLSFYERLGDDERGAVTYPEYYTIQATTDPADYRMLDVFPAHKNVAVEPDADRVLETVVDRAIDVLLVPDGTPAAPSVQETTRRSLARTIDSCYVYAPHGRLSDPEFEIELPREPATEWFGATMESMADPPAGASSSVETADDVIRQGFRRTTLESAIFLVGGMLGA